MKEIEIIPLALKKASRRGIPEEWIRETVEFPYQVVEGYGGRNVAQRKYLKDDKEYLLRVVYERQEETFVVITAYLTSQVERYWKEDA
jgi:hypothetical protein